MKELARAHSRLTTNVIFVPHLLLCQTLLGARGAEMTPPGPPSLPRPALQQGWVGWDWPQSCPCRSPGSLWTPLSPPACFSLRISKLPSACPRLPGPRKGHRLAHPTVPWTYSALPVPQAEAGWRFLTRKAPPAPLVNRHSPSALRPWQGRLFCGPPAPCL